jgi:hypothetical protein
LISAWKKYTGKWDGRKHENARLPSGNRWNERRIESVSKFLQEISKQNAKKPVCIYGGSTEGFSSVSRKPILSTTPPFASVPIAGKMDAEAEPWRHRNA